MYEYLKKVQALAEEIGPVTNVNFSSYKNGYIEVSGEFQNGQQFTLTMTISEGAANE